MSKISDNQPKTAAVSITTTLQDEQGWTVGVRFLWGNGSSLRHPLITGSGAYLVSYNGREASYFHFVW